MAELLLGEEWVGTTKLVTKITQLLLRYDETYFSAASILEQ